MNSLSIEEVRRSIEHGVNFLVDEVKEVREHNIMFYGFGGDLTEKSLNSIATSHRYFREKLKKIYLIGREYEDEKKREMLVEKFKHTLGELGPQAPEIIGNSIEPNEISSYLDEIDIFILTAGISKKGFSDDRVDRGLMTKDNFPLIDKIGPLLNGFQGHVHIVTNQPEILCYKLASETGLDPHQISGHSHIDKKRLDSKISEYFGNVDTITEAFCVGYHGCVWPVLNKLRVNSGNGFKGVNQAVEDSLQSKIEDIKTFLERYGDEQVISLRGGGYTEKRSTSNQAGDSIRDFILTYIFPGRIGVVNASVFLDHIYSAAPTYLIGGKARPNRPLWNRMSEKDIKEYEKRKGELENILDSFHLRISSRLDDIENDWEKEDPTKFKNYSLPQEVSAVGNERDKINKNGLDENVRDSGTKGGVISGQKIEIRTVNINIYQGKEGVEEVRVDDKEKERREIERGDREILEAIKRSMKKEEDEIDVKEKNGIEQKDFNLLKENGLKLSDLIRDSLKREEDEMTEEEKEEREKEDYESLDKFWDYH